MIPQSNNSIRCFVLVAACFLSLARIASGSAESSETIQKLIDQLGAESFSDRQHAHQQLIEIGEAARSELIRATESRSLEIRYRARQILRQMVQRSLFNGFVDMSRRADDRIDLEQGMWLISRILDPTTREEDLDRQLDEIASAVRRRLGEDFDSKIAAPADAVDALAHVLKHEYRFEGNRSSYDEPNNSSLARVFETRKGLPILLSHIAVSVGRRLDIPIVGLAIPSRYMIKYNGIAAPKGQPQLDIIIDPYGGWEVLTTDEVKKIIPSFDPEVHLQPCSKRAALSRMLRNLISDFVESGEPQKAEETRRYLDLMEPGE